MIQSSIKKILILGSGAIKIGQAGEFDYSGSQAIKAFKQEGIVTVLINPNIATIQTSEHLADIVYFLPITQPFVEQVIEREHPDGIVLGFGGQTALNVGIQLYKSGILQRNNVVVLGSPVESILQTEDRELFNETLHGIDLKTAVSKTAETTQEAVEIADKIGYPVMIRGAYALGGLGSGAAYSDAELTGMAQKALSHTHQILVEEFLGGWKEVEYEVVRDCHDNCIVVCSMENLDPMGIHTGESIVVAPVQTLSASENFMLRSIAIQVIRHLGIVGECNIQFALDPHSTDYRIIEVNARLSRSSALASKATGYPLAAVAAKLSLGYGLTELTNTVTGVTSACFEPALDYVALKYPRWDLMKFQRVDPVLGSEMKSVGEVMAIGRSLEEVLQKAIRMLDVGARGLVCNDTHCDALEEELTSPTDKRLFAVAQALEEGYSVEKIHQLTRIDPWFLYKIDSIVTMKRKLAAYRETSLSPLLLLEAKQKGFSDEQIALLIKSTEQEVRASRQNNNIIPCVKRIDTLAAEYPAQTNYLYLTYNASCDDIPFTTRDQVIVLGSGPYRIGSSVEFDWCCVHSVLSLKKADKPTIVINCNPETVSTDYDICDKLYFEELTLERVLDITDKEHIAGIVVSVGGQVANSLALPLYQAGMPILGTSPVDIDRAEDRFKFSQLLDEQGIDQPQWKELTSIKDAEVFSESVGYPVLIRPSYVLSGAAMSIALDKKELNRYLQRASAINNDHPVVISKFITKAKEIDIDAVAHNGAIHCLAISEHIENAGVHSGDATLVLPPQRTYLETIRQVKMIAGKIASALHITGPFNIQFIARDNHVKVIECNLRASRSLPFASKVLKLNFIDEAIRIMLGEKVHKPEASALDLDYVGIKAPEFSFTRLKGSDPIQNIEMTSTGEVACLGNSFNETFLKSLLSVGFTIPKKTILLSTGPIESKAAFLKSLNILAEMDYRFYATAGTAEFMHKHGFDVEMLHWPSENLQPNVMNFIEDGKIDMVINIPKNAEETELNNNYLIRRKAVDFNIPLITNIQLAKRFVESISSTRFEDLQIKSWNEYR